MALFSGLHKDIYQLQKQQLQRQQIQKQLQQKLLLQHIGFQLPYKNNSTRLLNSSLQQQKQTFNLFQQKQAQFDLLFFNQHQLFHKNLQQNQQQQQHRKHKQQQQKQQQHQHQTPVFRDYLYAESGTTNNLSNQQQCVSRRYVEVLVLNEISLGPFFSGSFKPCRTQLFFGCVKRILALRFCIHVCV